MKEYTRVITILLLMSFGLVLVLMTVAIFTPKKDVTLCQQEENALYETRWAQRCAERGEKTAVCKLSLHDVEEIGWDNHVARSEACKR